MNLDSRDLPAHLFQLSHSRNKKNRERNKRLKIWQRTKICIRKICIERKILSPKIFLNALLLKLVVNDCVALVSRHRSPQRWYCFILFQVHPDTSSDLFSDPSYLSSRSQGLKKNETKSCIGSISPALTCPRSLRYLIRPESIRSIIAERGGNLSGKVENRRGEVTHWRWAQREICNTYSDLAHVPGHSLSVLIRPKSRYFFNVCHRRPVQSSILRCLLRYVSVGRERIKRPVCKDSLWTITPVIWSPAGGTGTHRYGREEGERWHTGITVDDRVAGFIHTRACTLDGG